MQTAPRLQLKESPAIRLKKAAGSRVGLSGLRRRCPTLHSKSAADLPPPATLNNSGPRLDLNKSSRHIEALNENHIPDSLHNEGDVLLCSCMHIRNRPGLDRLRLRSSSAFKLARTRPPGRTVRASKAAPLESRSQETDHLHSAAKIQTQQTSGLQRSVAHR